MATNYKLRRSGMSVKYLRNNFWSPIGAECKGRNHTPAALTLAKCKCSRLVLYLSPGQTCRTYGAMDNSGHRMLQTFRSDEAIMFPNLCLVIRRFRISLDCTLSCQPLFFSFLQHIPESNIPFSPKYRSPYQSTIEVRTIWMFRINDHG